MRTGLVRGARRSADILDAMLGAVAAVSVGSTLHALVGGRITNLARAAIAGLLASGNAFVGGADLPKGAVLILPALNANPAPGVADLIVAAIVAVVARRKRNTGIAKATSARRTICALHALNTELLGGFAKEPARRTFRIGGAWDC